MYKYVVEKSPALKGVVRVGGSKNSALPIMAAAILTEDKCTICDIPPLNDVLIMQSILTDIGCTVDFNKKDCTFFCEAKHIKGQDVGDDLIRQIRASFLIMGPLLARTGFAKMALPGGCAIGTRPIDLHLKGFSALGAEIFQEHGFVVAKSKGLTGAKIYLDFPSVGATENIMMAAALAKGLTVLENAAVEPEIVDLANFLNSCGAQIRGAGTDTIRITGVQELHGTTHTIIPDRIEAGTFMVAAAITNGDIQLENVVIDHLKPVIAKLSETNVKIQESDNGIRVFSTDSLKAMDLKTMPFPGFPTDMQAPMMSLLSIAEGTSIIIETVFENRFMHVSELNRMGADIKIESRSAVIEGVRSLSASKVKATDLRAGAALILSAICAKGTSEVSDIYHIERGYYNIECKLRSLGARIEKIAE